jgi:hypothetical protein
MVFAGGLKESGVCWITPLSFNRRKLIHIWRYAFNTHHHDDDMRLEQSMHPGGAGPFLKGDMQASAKSVKELQDCCGFRFENAFHLWQLAGRNRTTAEIVAW